MTAAPMKRLPLIFLLVVVAAFAAGLLHLFQLRFATGDIYPAYSTFRADPLGAKALYESLERLVSVQRNFQPLPRLGESRDATFFVLGLDPRELRAAPDELKVLEGFVADGGRMVISLAPSYRKPTANWFEREKKRPSKTTNSPPSKANRKQSPPPKRSPFGEEDDESEARQIPLGERWKFQLDYAVAIKNDKGVSQPIVAQRETEVRLPESLEWHSAAWFSKPDAAWRVIYAREKGRAVAMERRFGSGTIVLLTDSYHFSNEALRQGRHADLLAWMVGPNHRVIFDEAHLGVQEETGVATLARKYRLHGLFLALLVLAGLFIWKNSVPFMPPPEEQIALERGDHVLGKASAAGFVNLLRRNIRAADVLGACFNEWKKSCGRGISATKLEQVRAIADAEAKLAARERHPVQAYQAISNSLAKPRFKS